MDSQLQSLKQWKPNDRCLYGSRQAIIFKITHNGRRCTLSVCEAAERSDLLNWVRRSNVPINDLEEFPPVPRGGFKWDERGFLDWRCLNDSLPEAVEVVEVEVSSADNESGAGLAGSEVDSLPEAVEVEVGSADNESGAGLAGSEVDSLPEAVEVEVSSADNESENGEESRVRFGCVAKYQPKGSARAGPYYRYQWKENGTLNSKHIPGGAVGKPRTEERARIVRELIAKGKYPSEIIEVIEAWK